jgi:lambda family phage portal protein
MAGNWIDKAIGVFSPKWELERTAYRKQREMLASYNGAVATRFSTPWGTSQQPQSLYAMQAYEHLRMRDRARNLDRNNAIANGLLTRAVENVVGQGFQFQATANNPEWSDEQNHAWNQKAEALMSGWFETCDITGLTWLEHQRLLFRSHLRDGDVGSILVDDKTYGVRLQPVEGDLIATPNKAAPKNVVDGVALGLANRPVSFYIASYDTAGTASSVEIAAENFVFMPRLNRLTQIRGEPCFAQSFTLFDQIDGWIEATLINARMAACFGIAIFKNNPANLLGNVTTTTTNNAGQQQREINVEPGMMPVFENGEKIETISPGQPQQSFPENLTMMLRLVGVPLGMPVELVTLDFSRPSFAAVRAAMLQAYNSFKSMQQLFIDRYLRRVYRWRISKLIKAGLLEPHPDAWSHRWIGAPFPFIDPVKELQGIQMAIDMGLESLDAACAAQGRDYEQILASRTKQISDYSAAGIPLIHSAGMQPFNQPTPAIVAAVDSSQGDYTND